MHFSPNKYYEKNSDYDAKTYDFTSSEALVDYCQNKLKYVKGEETTNDTLIFIHKNKNVHFNNFMKGTFHEM